MQRMCKCKDCEIEKVCVKAVHCARGSRRWCDLFIQKEEKKSGIRIRRWMWKHQIEELRKRHKEQQESKAKLAALDREAAEKQAAEPIAEIKDLTKPKGIFDKVKGLFGK